MGKRTYIIILFSNFILLVLSAFAIINSMVSLKYEVDKSNDCISMITGSDLCFQKVIFQYIFIFSIIAILFSLYQVVLKKN